MRRWLSLLVVAIPAAAVALLWTSPPVTAQPIPPPAPRYTAGDGLTLTGTDFDINTGTGLAIAADTVLVDIVGASCGVGEAVTAISATGTGTCSAVGADGNDALVTNGVIPKGNGTTQVASIMTESAGVIGVSGGVYATGTGIFDGDVTLGDAITDVVTISGLLGVSGTAQFDDDVNLGDDATDVTQIVGFLNANADLGSVGDVLTLDGSGLPTWEAPSGAIDGTGTANRVSKWSDADTLADSTITDNGTTVSTTIPFTSSGKITAGTGTSDGFAIDSDATIVYDSGSSELDITANGGTFGLGSSGKFQTTGDILGGGDGQFTGAVSGSSLSTTGNTELGSDSSDTLTVNAIATVAQLRGTVQTSTSTGTLNDFTLDDNATVLRFSGAGAPTINGITGGADGRVLILVNVSGGSIIVTSEAGGSTAGNRFTLVGALNLYVANNGTATFIYDGTSSRWRAEDDFISYALSLVTSLVVGTNATINGTVVVGGVASFNGGAAAGNAWADDLDITAETQYMGTAPTLSGCTGSCSIESYSTNHRGRITCTDDSGSDCTVTFADSGWETNPPACSLTFEDSTAPSSTPYVKSVSTTAFSFDQNTTGAHAYSYHCDGMM